LSDPGEHRPAAAGASSTLTAGRVGRPHGLDGSFYVTRPQPRLLTAGERVTVGGRTLEIVRRAGTDRRPIVRLDGVVDRAGAEDLRGLDLTVPADRAPSLQEGEWWAHELEGCTVLDGELTVGVVTSLIELPSCEALEVAPAGGGAPLLVPMVKEAIRAVEPEQRRVQVDLAFLGLEAGPGGGGA
jgi:16S rRNA processing protein RimM